MEFSALNGTSVLYLLLPWLRLKIVEEDTENLEEPRVIDEYEETGLSGYHKVIAHMRPQCL